MPKNGNPWQVQGLREVLSVLAVVLLNIWGWATIAHLWLPENLINKWWGIPFVATGTCASLLTVVVTICRNSK